MTRDELAAAGFEVTPAIYGRLSRFVALLLRENQRTNLTAIRAAEEVWRLHVCESLALLPLVAELRPRRLLDLGTGGGVPGIPLACACDALEVTLLDATRKKLDAVQRIVSELALPGVATLWGRAETLAHDHAHRETYDVVTARAVAALPALLECAAGFVRVGGQCWFPKSPAAAAREVEAARRAADQCGLTHAETRCFTLPNGGGQRVTVVYLKRQPLRPDLPRPPGRPAKRPL
jgi:16S rRNA (guanine527-N7)-methyltransferase